MSLFDAIAKHARGNPQSPALLSSQQRLDYQALWQQIQRLANQLQQLNISRLALQLDNGLPWALLDLACTKAGIVVIPVPHFFSQAQQAWLLESSGADALVGPHHQGWHAAEPLSLITGELPLWRHTPTNRPTLPKGTAKITYTSGTTGQPKGVIRPTAGHLVALNWTMTNLYKIEAGDVFWAASDVGWVVGHSYICYGPLIAGATTIVFEGKPVGTPDAGTFWRVIQNHKVKSFFTAPTALRAIKREDSSGSFIKDYNLKNLQALFLAGERADPATIEWAQQHLGVPVIDHWWQTETGWAIAGNPLGIELLPVKVGSPTVAMPGYDVQVLDEGGHPLPAGQLGAIAIKLPLPPGTLPTLWNAEERFRKSYLNTFPGYYETGDAGYIDDNGYVYIMARTDDVINVAGHRLSTGAMEEVLASHPDVGECAVIGVADELKGQLPMGFLCLNKGTNRPHAEVIRECVGLVRDQIGPVAAFKLACVVDRLPKTRSGKILRATMVKIADGEAFKTPATIDDPAILDEIRAALKTLGYARG